ncbi:hypothetical protein ARMSODRAFT_1019394 [Armillaria solidipes]|uniref:Heterokaryon incompatibility domain-containing protein n=1 Tax=Armillaria solidipes TaxID=1076256 RepID=A0A2H3BIR6_9AGAR|nr:hypothetical protein ARMSODRAFT_1019394 [Armillaria solidipes]
MEEQPLSDTPEDTFYYARPPEDISFPEVTISAFTETGQAETSIMVPLQQAYTGREPVISSRLADTPCATLGIQGLLDQLNTTFGTSYSLDTPSLSSLLEDCITNNYDFGTTYGRLRQIWYTDKWSTGVQHILCKWEEKDREMRQKALIGNQIINPRLQPRRVWDLCSNRVLPWWAVGMHNRPLPISHGWMDEKHRVNVWTPINGYEWPVPIPRDANLDLIRIEMLNLGAEYTWLDVLCLRQVGGRGEDVRKEEWKLDVPTIGVVYQSPYFRNPAVVCYLSGLGQPCSLKEGDLNSDRSWFRRAWTLQEVGITRVIAGDTPDGPLHVKPMDKDGNYETELLTRFHKQLQSMGSIVDIFSVFAALKGMQNRVSTNPLDKVAGLTFCLGSQMMPSYDETQSLEEAWTALVNSMHTAHRGRLFSLYPESGNAGTKWRPSWEQVMMTPLPDHEDFSINVNRNEMDEDWCYVECIEKGFVQGLAVVEGVDRHGELIVKDENGVEHVFNVMATHKCPIPEDVYTLIGTDPQPYPQSFSWVLGKRLSGERFEKVSILQIMVWKDRQRLSPLRRKIMKWCRFILI